MRRSCVRTQTLDDTDSGSDEYLQGGGVSRGKGAGRRSGAAAAPGLAGSHAQVGQLLGDLVGPLLQLLPRQVGLGAVVVRRQLRHIVHL